MGCTNVCKSNDMCTCECVNVGTYEPGRFQYPFRHSNMIVINTPYVVFLSLELWKKISTIIFYLFNNNLSCITSPFWYSNNKSLMNLFCLWWYGMSAMNQKYPVVWEEIEMHRQVSDSLVPTQSLLDTGNDNFQVSDLY